ncbi:MAG: protein kinase [Abitibacteriaceae bacterium]|nr:protein kinase [Abditibacteriaceae bacterium]MBV9865896.1 protein kinase [Abditibacteriaceae bacterium]
MLLKPGEQLQGAHGSYEMIEVIGQGAYGTVFRARDTEGNFVVVKQLYDTGSGSAEDFEYQRKLFHREAEILTQVNYPKIVHGIELIERDPDLFFVMELVQGHSLRKVFDDWRIANSNQPFPPETVTAVGIEICDALHYLHQLPGQIIYRDLKPENVMWDANQQVCKLIDFGTARFSAKSRKVTQGLGTEGYAPPELYSTRADVTFSADVFTIGAVMYELLTGESPEPKSTPRDFRGFDPRIPDGLKTIVLTALQLDPLRRYQTAGAMGDALRALGLQTTGPALQAVGAPRATNLHPLLSCFCPHCGAVPRTERAVFCGKCRTPIHTVMLRVLPRNTPPTLLYLQKEQSILGRTDPDTGIFPDVDLSRFDAGRYVSRRHATIKRDGTQFFITAHRSLNPTRIDGFAIAPETTVPLQDGARLEFADLICNFVIRPVVQQ